jgi:hypothetical protein
MAGGGTPGKGADIGKKTGEAARRGDGGARRGSTKPRTGLRGDASLTLRLIKYGAVLILEPANKARIGSSGCLLPSPMYRLEGNGRERSLTLVAGSCMVYVLESRS